MKKKKKKESFLLGKLYHPVARQIHHRQAHVPTSLGSGKFFPWLATLSFTPHHPECQCSMQSLVANFQRPGRVVTAQGQPTQLERMAFQLGEKKNAGIFRKGAPAFVPWCHHPVISPNYKQSGLDTPYNLNQIQRNIQISPSLNKNDLVWAHIRCMSVLDAATWKLSL